MKKLTLLAVTAALSMNMAFAEDKTEQRATKEEAVAMVKAGVALANASGKETLYSNIQWETQHFLTALIPWPTKIGYYKNKFVMSVPTEAIAILPEFFENDVNYAQALEILKSLKNNTLPNVSMSSFELKVHDTTMHVPLNTFIKILGPAEIGELKEITVFGLPFIQWNDQWLPLITDALRETKYIGITQHHNGLWAFPLKTAPKLIQSPAQINDVLRDVLSLLTT